MEGLEKVAQKLSVPLLTRPVDCDRQDIPPSSRQRKQLVKSRHIKVSTWNVRTRMDADNSSRPHRRTALIASELSRYNIYIAALSETRLADEGSLNEMANGYTFFWKGLPANSRRIHGVGFATRTKLLQTLPESPVAISERLMTLRNPLAKHRYATFISTYAPTLPSDDETKDHYYAMLRSTLMQVPRRDKLIVLGDFNAIIGSDSKI